MLLSFQHKPCELALVSDHSILHQRPIVLSFHALCHRQDAVVGFSSPPLVYCHVLLRILLGYNTVCSMTRKTHPERLFYHFCHRISYHLSGLTKPAFVERKAIKIWYGLCNWGNLHCASKPSGSWWLHSIHGHFVRCYFFAVAFSCTLPLGGIE